MAEIRPFRGVRYNPAIAGDLATVVAAPYDIISPEAQDAYYSRSPYNVIALELGSERTGDTPTDNRYTRAAATYQDWLRSGVLSADSRAGFYLYEEQFADHRETRVRRSLFAPIRLANWEDRVVLPHEFTLPGPKVDRLNLLTATRAQFSPLLAMYDDPGRIRQLLVDVAKTPPAAEFTLSPGSVAAAADTHRLWHLADPALVAEIADAFRPLQIYIADGHHRYETALVYRDQQRRTGASADAPSEFALMALVETDDPGMLIRPTHRLLRGLGPIDHRATLRQLGERFEIERIPVDDPLPGTSDNYRPTFIIVGLEPGWAHRLRLRPTVDLGNELPGVPAILRSLDTVVLQRLIFETVFGLSPGDAESGERIRFTRDPTEASQAIADGQAQLVVYLNATPMEQIRAAAKAGERMPQKSTYFYPKPLTGVVFYDHARAFEV